MTVAKRRVAAKKKKTTAKKRPALRVPPHIVVPSHIHQVGFGTPQLNPIYGSRKARINVPGYGEWSLYVEAPLISESLRLIVGCTSFTIFQWQRGLRLVLRWHPAEGRSARDAAWVKIDSVSNNNNFSWQMRLTTGFMADHVEAFVNLLAWIEANERTIRRRLRPTT